MFELIAPPLQRVLWELGWKTLREVQTQALALLLRTDEDVVISASTAAGKTEAAFLPLLTRAWRNAPGSAHLNDSHGVQPASPREVILYIAPVKALINDQIERLTLFCEPLNLPVYPWHGDAGQSQRKRFFADPRGVVLITPESLEALLFKRGAELALFFATLQAVVVDELHAFIGNVRGRQLQSLLHRIELQIGRRVQRVGLSATLGDMGLAAEFLRPGLGNAVHVLVGSGEKKRLQLAVKAVLQAHPSSGHGADAHAVIAGELFERLRGANYLVFPAGVGMVELYADALRKHCEDAGLPVTYFPHHGRLAKSEREETESELKRGQLPITAICTTTLEMGIDIGAIKGVVQIGAPQTVANLCQRIGRAGRRDGDIAVLWQYCVVETITSDTECVDGLYQDLVQAIAAIKLFTAKWYEPPHASALHYSTLIQQLMSLIGERHGVMAAQAYQILCKTGPFREVTETNFIALLRQMAAKDLLAQDKNKLLLHGGLGEKLVNHYAFYAAFPDSHEYRLRQGGKDLGTLPLPSSSAPGDVITFAGRRWRIEEIDHEKRLVNLVISPSGKLPQTGGLGLPVHTKVRQEMCSILASSEAPVWLDATARKYLKEAQNQFRELQLQKTYCVVEGANVYLFIWQGDQVQTALAALLASHGLHAQNRGICIKVQHSTRKVIEAVIEKITAEPCPRPEKVLSRKQLSDYEKWDWVLPDDLYIASYASRAIALEEAHAVCKRILQLQ